jgi:hypothetical protein
VLTGCGEAVAEGVGDRDRGAVELADFCFVVVVQALTVTSARTAGMKRR